MGQVPQRDQPYLYLIVGNGRIARHFHRYFQLLSIPHLHWWRGQEKDISPLLKRVNKVLVLIKDDNIEKFIQEHPDKITDQNYWIHCSGLLTTPLAESAHPLMTFADELYDLAWYEKIPFVTEIGRKSFPELFPELSNPHVSIPPEQKQYYHAWCSMAGNFTTILWQEFLKILEEKFQMKREMAFPYIEQIIRNIKAEQNPLTGPLAREDWLTVKKHRDSLENNAFSDVYEAFVNVYRSIRSEY